MNKTKLFSKFLLIVCLVVLVISVKGIGRAQSSDDQEQRDIIRRLAEDAPKKIAKARRKAQNRKPDDSKPSNQADYTLVGSSANTSASLEGVSLGFTFWILKDADANDDSQVAEVATRITKVKSGNKIKENAQSIKVVPRRASSNTQFSNGDWLRISLDLPVNGHIYIFNREKYIDGTLGVPYLIFPREEDRGKSDKATIGKLLFLPNEPDYFEIEESGESKKEKLEEVYYVLVSPVLLQDITLLKTNEPEPISLEIFNKYEKFSAPLLKFESQSEVNKAITKVEKLSNTQSNESLAEDDPLPQTIYHIKKLPEDPIFFSISAGIKR